MGTLLIINLVLTYIYVRRPGNSLFEPWLVIAPSAVMNRVGRRGMGMYAGMRFKDGDIVGRCVLCNHEKAALEFFLIWLAQMVQHPAEKSNSVILVSKPGAGKGRLLLMLSVWLGKKKVFEPSNPKRDVWGDFNGPMKEAFLVNLNEISPKDFFRLTGSTKLSLRIQPS